MDGAAHARDAGSNCVGVAPGAEAVDSADSRNHELHRLEENVKAADVELTAEDLAEIESAASQITIQGARYPEAMKRMSNR